MDVKRRSFLGAMVAGPVAGVVAWMRFAPRVVEPAIQEAEPLAAPTIIEVAGQPMAPIECPDCGRDLSLQDITATPRQILSHTVVCSGKDCLYAWHWDPEHGLREAHGKLHHAS